MRSVLAVAASLAAMAAVAAVPAAAQTPDFYQHWGDGRAEISSYRVIQPRYGEARQGYGVLIFVTEDVNRNTYIKVESPTPEAERAYSLKLNSVLKFGTGIYDYSVMTSVFSEVEPPAGGSAFQPLRVTLTSQEWCGHVFEEVAVRDGALRGSLYSYFESEGRQRYELEQPADLALEDHLLIRIRELRGEHLAQGEQRPVSLLPSLWEYRLRQGPRALVEGVLGKGYEQRIEVGERSFEAVPWRWEVGPRQKMVWVEKAYPHRILAWEDSDGGRGELIETVREPYWDLKRNRDAIYRERLGLP